MRLLSIVFMLCCFTLSMSAQEKRNGPDREKVKGKMEAQKIAFITQELDLSAEEAQRFWPVYNQFNKEMEVLKKDKPRRKDREEVVLTDAEAAAELNSMIDMEKKLLAIKEDYIGRLKNVLSIQKVAKLYRLEKTFKRQMLSRLGKSREKRRMKSEK